MPVANEPHTGARVGQVLGAAFVLLLLAAVVAVGTATGALPGCESCHFRENAFEVATNATAHGQTSCVACHVETNKALARTKFGVYQVFGMWLPILDPASTDAVAVKDGQCLSCHPETLRTVITAEGIVIKHATCVEGRTCVDCHSEVGHGSATSWPKGPSMNDCVSCHSAKGAEAKCETCHTARHDDDRFGVTEFAVTHGPNWRKTHGMGQMNSCSVCHQEDSCVRCHGLGVPHASGFITDHDAVSAQPGARCATCHPKTFCFDCHQMEMPHEPEFASKHSRIVRDDGEQVCMRCHASSDCDGCHNKHVHPGGAVGGLPAPSRSGN